MNREVPRESAAAAPELGIPHALDTSGLLEALRTELASRHQVNVPNGLTPVRMSDVVSGALERAAAEVGFWSKAA